MRGQPSDGTTVLATGASQPSGEADRDGLLCACVSAASSGELQKRQRTDEDSELAAAATPRSTQKRLRATEATVMDTSAADEEEEEDMEDVENVEDAATVASTATVVPMEVDGEHTDCGHAPMPSRRRLGNSNLPILSVGHDFDGGRCQCRRQSVDAELWPHRDRPAAGPALCGDPGPGAPEQPAVPGLSVSN